MYVRFFNIKWDTTSEQAPVRGQQVNLPSESEFYIAPDHYEGLTCDEYLEEEAANILSDFYGWCVSQVEFEILPDRKDEHLDDDWDREPT